MKQHGCKNTPQSWETQKLLYFLFGKTISKCCCSFFCNYSVQLKQEVALKTECNDKVYFAVKTKSNYTKSNDLMLLWLQSRRTRGATSIRSTLE